MILGNRRVLLLISFLGLVSTFSVIQGINNALIRSQDFQWSPSVLFWRGENPYSWFLNGNPNGEIILSQFPNYAHFLYLFLLPFTWLPWLWAKLIWALISISMGITAAIILCRVGKLNWLQTLFVLLVFLSSTPLRSNLGNGQHALLVLFLIAISIKLKSSFAAMFQGFSFFKYSFMPPFIILDMLNCHWKRLIISTTPIIVGWITFSLILNENPLSTLIQPIIVGNSSVKGGTGDVYSLLKAFPPIADLYLARFLGYLLSLAVCILLVFYIRDLVESDLSKVSSLFIVSLISFVHLGYDYVVLLPTFILAIKQYKSKYSVISVLVIIYFWFGLRFAHQSIPMFLETLLNCFLLLVLLYSSMKNNGDLKEKRQC